MVKSWNNAEKSVFRSRVRDWFRANSRDLPWRKTQHWYPVWLSETMLQQTQVATVISYFNRFLATFPTVQALANADEHEVLRLWEGLGYYRRARQLHAAAKVIVEKYEGEFPRDTATAQTLPGIGRYTAGAILSIAFDQREPILEANTVRLFSRLLLLDGPPTTKLSQAELWQFAEDILPRDHTGEFNQALMELGSEVCFPRSPHCGECPARQLCPTNQHGWQDRIPVPKPKKNYEDVTHLAFVIRRGNQVLLRTCESHERWAGLWDFPRIEQSRDANGGTTIQQVRSMTGLDIKPTDHLITIRHGVTRFRITLHCSLAKIEKGRAKAGTKWVDIHELHEYALNTTGRKIARALGQLDEK